MDHVLPRTRRNMMGLSVAIILVNTLGWKVPEKVTVFENDFSADPQLVSALIWAYLAYMCWEYYINAKDFGTDFRTRWRMQFAAKFVGKYRRQHIKFMSDLSDDDHRSQLMAMNQKSGITAELEFQRTDVGLHRTSRWYQVFVVVHYYHGRQPSGSIKIVQHSTHNHKVYYIRALPKVLRTWWVCVVLDKDYFEHVLPFVFAGIAALSPTFRPVASLIAKFWDRIVP